MWKSKQYNVSKFRPKLGRHTLNNLRAKGFCLKGSYFGRRYLYGRVHYNIWVWYTNFNLGK